MRWLVIAAVAAFCSSAVTAMPSGVAEVPAADVAAPYIVADPADLAARDGFTANPLTPLPRDLFGGQARGVEGA